MAIFGGNTQQVIIYQSQAKLAALRNALDDVVNFYLWLTAYANSDLVAAGFSSADASALLAAFADGNALCQIYRTGLPPGTYPQPPSAYVYAASQRTIIGPLG